MPNQESKFVIDPGNVVQASDVPVISGKDKPGYPRHVLDRTYSIVYRY